MNDGHKCVCGYLLKKRDYLRSAPFVGFGQIDVLEEQDEVLALFGLEHTPGGRAHLDAHLGELLQHVTRVRLRRAVNGGHLGRAQLGETLLEHETFAAAVRSDQQEWLLVGTL